MWFAEELRRLEEQGLRRELRAVEGGQGRVVQIAGRSLVNFSSNDYLGLAADERLKEASQRAAGELGTGAGASRLIVGNLELHQRFEAEFARLSGAESACLFNSGYCANVGALQALAGPGDVIVSDELNHASIIDGCRLSRAAVQVYRHGDVDDAGRKLAAASGARRRLLVTDSLFSMDGDRAPLQGLSKVARRYGALFYVDEAHAMGVIGARGRGVSEEAGVAPDVTVATLGKAFGSFGAVVLGAAELREWLLNRARSYVFTTGLPPAVVAASLAATRLVFGSVGEELRQRVWRNVENLGVAVADMGLPVPESQIWPLVLGREDAAMSASAELLKCGVLGQGIRPPTVPAGASRIRFTVTAAHTSADLLALQAGLKRLGGTTRAVGERSGTA